MDPTKLLILVQIIVQIILVGFVVFFIVIEKKRRVSTTVLDELKTVVRETQTLAENFHEQINRKVEIVSTVMDELDARIKEAEAVMKGLEKTSLNTTQGREYTRSDVVKLYKGGFDPVEISRITRMPLGEIQLMVKLKDQDNS